MESTRAWETVDSLIGPGCLVEGVVVFRGGLRVDGEIAGGVRGDPGTGSCLLLSGQGRIMGDVSADHISIGGELVGNLHAAGRVELLPRARIIGNISYTSLAMHAGACVAGRLCPGAWQAASTPAALQPSGYNPGPLVQNAGALT